MPQRDLFVSCLDYSNSHQMASSFHLIPLLSLLYKEARGIFSWTKLLNMYFIKPSCPYITMAQLSKSRQSNWPSTTIQSTGYSLCINCPNKVLSYLFLHCTGSSLKPHVTFSGHAALVSFKLKEFLSLFHVSGACYWWKIKASSSAEGFLIWTCLIFLQDVIAFWWALPYLLPHKIL